MKCGLSLKGEYFQNTPTFLRVLCRPPESSWRQLMMEDHGMKGGDQRFDRTRMSMYLFILFVDYEICLWVPLSLLGGLLFHAMKFLDKLNVAGIECYC